MEHNRCEPSCCDKLIAQFGLPDRDSSLYDAVVKIASNSPVVHSDSSTVELTGQGTPSSPLIANLVEGAIVSTDGSVEVTQDEDGVFDLSVTATPSSVVVEDTATVILAGDGTPGSPITASFAPGAIASADASVVVTQQPDGTFDLSVAALPTTVVTEDTPTILLSGDGSPGDPLEANLAAGAITSDDGTVAVVQQGDGSFDLSVEFTSPDSSILFTPTNQAVVATTFTGSSTIDVVGTPGTAVTPPDYAFSLSPTALIPSPNPALTPVDVQFIAGQFQLGVAIATGGVVPRTIVVGGEIGSTPNSPTLEGAVALLPSPIPLGEVWSLLFCPGEYGIVGTSVVIGDRVSLKALVEGTVTILSPISIIADDVANSQPITVTGLIFSDLFAVNATAKVTDPSYRVDVSSCSMLSNTSFSALPASRLVARMKVVNSTCLSLGASGSVLFESSHLSGGSIVVAQFGLFQAIASNIFPTTFTSAGFVSIISSALGGTWSQIVNGTGFFIDSCRLSPAWTFVNNSSIAVITNTPIIYEATVTSAVSWAITSPNLLTGNPIDRDLDCVVTTPGNAPNLQITYEVPFITTFIPPPVVSGSQVSACTLVVDGKRPNYTISSISVNGFQIANSPTVAGDIPMTVRIRPPMRGSVAWFDII